jgi:hypothetical protein
VAVVITIEGRFAFVRQPEPLRSTETVPGLHEVVLGRDLAVPWSNPLTQIRLEFVDGMKTASPVDLELL